MHGNQQPRALIQSPLRFDCVRPAGLKEKLQKGITAEMAIYHLSMKIIPEAAATAP